MPPSPKIHPSAAPTIAVETDGGWRVTCVTPARALAGTNGIRFGSDGRLYAVSAFGGEIVTVDPDTGAVASVVEQGGAIVSPDDLAFDEGGVMYVTECMNARVSAHTQDGWRVVTGGLTGANGIGMWRDRLFVTEFRPGGRLWELYIDGRAPRLLSEGLAGPNALGVRSDGYIYFGLVFTNQLARVPLSGGEPEIVAEDLIVPAAVKVVGTDERIWVAEEGVGRITEVDVASGRRRVIANVEAGIDNFDVSPDGRLFVSYHTTGLLAEVVDGDLRPLLPGGAIGPYGVAAPSRGSAFFADGSSLRALEDGQLHVVSTFTSSGFPGALRGLAATPRGLLAATTGGDVHRYEWADGARGEWSERLVGGLVEAVDLIAFLDGALVAEAGTGCILQISADGDASTFVEGFERPVGLAGGDGGDVYVSDERAGTVVAVSPSRQRTVLAEGLAAPQGLAAFGDKLWVLEVGAKRLVEFDLPSGGSRVIASDLPVGSKTGGVRKPTNGLPDVMPGPIVSFAGLACDGAGHLYVSGDEHGVALELTAATDCRLSK